MFRRDAGNERGTFGLLDTRPPVRVGKAVGPKAHVLVCAPSNSALDEIVSRLLQAGLLDWCLAYPSVPTLVHLPQCTCTHQVVISALCLACACAVRQHVAAIDSWTLSHACSAASVPTGCELP